MRAITCLYYLCPLIPICEYRITVENCSPFFLRLIERRGDNILLKNADVNSADFLLAFMESLTFMLPKHKREFLSRLAVLLLEEGKQI